MITKTSKVVMKGKLYRNNYGECERYFIDDENVINPLYDFANKNIKITIEEIDEEEE
jgi:hypothetical protein